MRRKRRKGKSKTRLERIRRRRRVSEADHIRDIEKTRDKYDNPEVSDRGVRGVEKPEDREEEEGDYRKQVRDVEGGEDDGTYRRRTRDVEDDAKEPKRSAEVDRRGTDPVRRLNTSYKRRGGRRKSYKERTRRKRNSRRKKRVKESRSKDKPRRFPRKEKSVKESKTREKTDLFFDDEGFEDIVNEAFDEITETMNEKDVDIDNLLDVAVKEAKALPNHNLQLKTKVVKESDSNVKDIVIEGLMKVIDEDGIYECYVSDEDEELFDKDSKIKVKIEEGKVYVDGFDYKAFVESGGKKSHLVEGKVEQE